MSGFVSDAKMAEALARIKQANSSDLAPQQAPTEQRTPHIEMPSVPNIKETGNYIG